MKTTVYGDRAVASHCTFPPEAFYHHARGGCVLDVTQAPFFARGDGKSDDTAALCAAMTFVRDHCEVLRKHGNTMCSPKLNRNWIIYLPDGVYCVSDTVSQMWPALAMNILKGWNRVEYLRVASPEEERSLYERSRPVAPVLHAEAQLHAIDNNHGSFHRGQYHDALIYDEANWNIRIFGESRERTILRLRDNAPGFGPGSGRPVLSFALLERGSNVNLGNFLENLTVDTGCGNPGAVAVRWNSSNWGGIRNVRAYSGDGTGMAALRMNCNNATGYCRDLILEGFDIGIELSAGRETILVLEYATIRHMRHGGIHIGDARSGGGGDSFSGRKLLLEDMPLGVHCGFAGQGIVLESEFAGIAEAWRVGAGAFLLWRDTEVNGAPVPDGDSIPPAGGTPCFRHRLPVREVPVVASGFSPERGVCVEAFGALGDGVSDDTAAIQRAMDSGMPVICFSRSNYVINGSVDIPGSVREITGLFAGIQRAAVSESQGNGETRGLFRVSEVSAEPLLVRQITTGGGVFLDHDADRTVILEDILVWFNHCRADAAEEDMIFPSALPQDVPLWRLYRNSRPSGLRKELFVTGCLGFAGDDGSGGCAVENVTVWGRYLDTEHVMGALYSFRNSDVWIFGFKSENARTLIRACDRSRVEVLGGTFLNFSRYEAPLLMVEDSELTSCFLFWHWQIAPPVIRQDCCQGHFHCRVKADFSALEKADTAVIFCG